MCRWVNVHFNSISDWWIVSVQCIFLGVFGIILYLAGNCDDGQDNFCPYSILIFFSALAPVAALIMYINSLCLRPSFNQIKILTICFAANSMKSTKKTKVYRALKFNWTRLRYMLFNDMVCSLCSWPNGILYYHSKSLKTSNFFSRFSRFLFKFCTSKLPRLKTIIKT